MRRMRIITRILTVVALATSATSCGSAVNAGSGPVFLSIDRIGGIAGSATPVGNSQGSSLLISDVLTLVSQGGTCSKTAPCPTVFGDSGVATLRLVPKNVALTPSSNNDVTLTRVHVAYRRTDGPSVPGVDVPFPFDTIVSATVTAGEGAQVAFELVRVQAKLQSPLVQLVSSGVLAAVCDVTFYGQDRTGNNITVTGSIQAEFSNWAEF
jgi:hypothetical protein